MSSVAGASRVGVFTGTRAEYGILRRLLRRLDEAPDMRLDVLVSGAHLSPHHGHTVDEVRADGFGTVVAIESLLSSQTRVGVAKSVGLGIAGYADHLDRTRPDAMVILGDRYESFAAATTAYLLGIPIAHVHGGEITLGAMDDGLRHAMTKLASLHFTSTETHRRRVIQMGERPERVLNVGAPGLEGVATARRPDRARTLERLSLPSKARYVVACFHPVTNESDAGAACLTGLLAALETLDGHHVVFSTSNADPGHASVGTSIARFLEGRPDTSVRLESRGHADYLGVLGHADFLIGNSSSGIIEAPELRVPTIDVGSRQGGREAAASVLHVDGDAHRIVAAMRRTLVSPPADFDNPYSCAECSARMADALRALPRDPVKPFLDLPFVEPLIEPVP